MGLPKKDRKDDAKFKKPEKENTPPSDPDAISPEIVFTEMDAYQKELEKQWDQAKESYQNKIDQIMDDFLKEKGLDPEANPSPQSAESPDKPEEKKPAPIAESQKPSPKNQAKKNPSDRSFEEMVSDLKNSLKDASPEPRELVFKKTWVPSHIIPKRAPSMGAVKKSFPWMLSLFITLAAGVGVFWLLTVGSSTTLPYSHGATLQVSENNIIITDWFRKSIFIHQKRRGLPITSVENLPNDFLSGIFYQEGKPHTINGVTGELYVHADTEDHRVIQTLALPGAAMAGAWLDEAGLWTADNDSRKVFRLHPGDFQEIRDELSFKEGKIHSLQVSQNRIWTLDKDTRQIRVFRNENPLRLLASFDLDPFLDGAQPTAHFLEGRTLWVLTESPSQLLKIKRSALEKSLPTDF